MQIIFNNKATDLNPRVNIQMVPKNDDPKILEADKKTYSNVRSVDIWNYVNNKLPCIHTINIRLNKYFDFILMAHTVLYALKNFIVVILCYNTKKS